MTLMNYKRMYHCFVNLLFPTSFTCKIISSSSVQRLQMFTIIPLCFKLNFDCQMRFTRVDNRQSFFASVSIHFRASSCVGSGSYLTIIPKIYRPSWSIPKWPRHPFYFGLVRVLNYGATLSFVSYCANKLTFPLCRNCVEAKLIFRLSMMPNLTSALMTKSNVPWQEPSVPLKLQTVLALGIRLLKVRDVWNFKQSLLLKFKVEDCWLYNSWTDRARNGTSLSLSNKNENGSRQDPSDSLVFFFGQLESDK